MKKKKKRLKKVQELMNERNIDFLVIPLGANFRWLFNFLGEQSDRFIVALINQEDIPTLFAPEYERASLCNQVGLTNYIGWYEEDNPLNYLLNELKENEGTIAFDPHMWFTDFYHLSKELKHSKFIPAEEIFSNLRAVKDKEEQNDLIMASQSTADCIIETLHELHVGITDGEVMKILKEKFEKISPYPHFMEVTFAEDTAILPSFSTTKKLQKNDAIVIDAGLTINNYWGDITITSVFGKASSFFKEIYSIVNEANSLAKDLASGNSKASNVDKIARNYITKKGYGDFFTHRTGHGIGLEMHEEPFIVGKNHKKLISGNVFTIEPGIYLPGKFGIRIEDDVIKTDDSIKTSKIPRGDLFEIG